MSKIAIVIDLTSEAPASVFDKILEQATAIKQKYPTTMVGFFNRSEAWFLNNLPAKEVWDSWLGKDVLPASNRVFDAIIDGVASREITKCICFTEGILYTTKPAPCEWLWAIIDRVGNAEVPDEWQHKLPPWSIVWGERFVAVPCVTALDNAALALES